MSPSSQLHWFNKIHFGNNPYLKFGDEIPHLSSKHTTMFQPILSEGYQQECKPQKVEKKSLPRVNHNHRKLHEKIFYPTTLTGSKSLGDVSGFSNSLGLFQVIFFCKPRTPMQGEEQQLFVDCVLLPRSLVQLMHIYIDLIG